jgi:hypothetical protein
VRKLAREAVIFCLLGSILVIIGGFVIGERQSTGAAKSAGMQAVHAILPPPLGYILQDASGIHYVSVCKRGAHIMHEAKKIREAEFFYAHLLSTEKSQPDNPDKFKWYLSAFLDVPEDLVQEK